MNICIKKYKILTNHEFDLCKEWFKLFNCRISSECYMDKINDMRLKILRYEKIKRILDIST